MEEGSLLQTALQHAQESKHHQEENVLLLDVYSLRHYEPSNLQLLFLADLAVKINEFLQQEQNFCWHYGGDGPVFGIHLSEGVPHLRAYVRYGPNVLDEWMAIHMLNEVTKRFSNDEVVGMVWDVQDGQILLIQLAELLPESFDQDSTDRHKYSCWLRNGNLHLLEIPHVSISTALQNLLRVPNDHGPSHPKLQEAMGFWLELNQEEAKLLQRTPMVLPRNVATMLEIYPDFLHTAIQAFCSYLEHSNDRYSSRALQKQDPDEDSIVLANYEDWVWVTRQISRTNYAMVRTVTSKQWDDPNSTPIPLPVEIKRMQRTCNMDSATHLKHAVAIGVRVMVGLELLLQNREDAIQSHPLASLQDRILYWNRVEQTLSSNHSILESYQKGPNQSVLNLENIIKCPVFPEERDNLTLWTSPEASLAHQIRQGLKRNSNTADRNITTASTVPPKPDQVDGDEWMDVLMAKAQDGDLQIQSTEDLDSLLSKFQVFLQHKSGIGGVDSAKQDPAKHLNENTGPVKIQPRVFLNILHAVLKGDELIFPIVDESSAKDEFFYDEDYDDLVEVEDEEDDSGNKNFKIPSIQDMMAAMDLELEGRRKQDKPQEPIPSSTSSNDNHDDSEMQVLTNLLQSLDASGGGSGPVINMLKEMENSS
ncbi:SGT1 domain containing protein [Nitzschia inconspicua]|uniref:SGT1 domain containing protein n=1 Tax=Nitzschia inconspicua TaxID=303405 RepID=A0A9K3PNL7_9STRA|nr:SGT1 domain containing protein [Nitzschia inconspicua]